MPRSSRSLFLDLVRLAGAIPLAACAASVSPLDDATAPDGAIVDAATCRPHATNVGTCSASEIWPCNPPVMIPSTMIQTGNVCDMLCPDFVGMMSYDHLCERREDDASTSVSITCALCRGGRRPIGWRPVRSASVNRPLGEFFAKLAELEAASIPAFRALADDLRGHGAPADLMDLAREAVRDERAHTRSMGSLARRFGVRAQAPSVARRGAISLEALAIHNATEGCVGETFGALIATFQAAHARDAEVRAAMARIAEDETRHADLATAIAAWASRRLDDRARRRVAAARNRALDELRAEVAVDLHIEILATAGMPDARQTRVLVAGLTAALSRAA